MPLATRQGKGSSASKPRSSWEQLAVYGLGALAVIGIARKLYKTCVVRVAPDTVTVVYNVHRRSVFSSSTDEPLSPPRDTRRTVSGQLWRTVSHVARSVMQRGVWCLLFPASATFVVRPPFPMFATFSLPRPVLDASGGVAVDCVVEDVPVVDGNLRFTLTIAFFVDRADLNRYLTILGAVAPHEAIGRSVGACLRDEARKYSSGVLLAKQRRTTVFLPEFSAHLRSALCAECCVRVRDVVIESVQLVDSPARPS